MYLDSRWNYINRALLLSSRDLIKRLQRGSFPALAVNGKYSMIRLIGVNSSFP